MKQLKTGLRKRVYSDQPSAPKVDTNQLKNTKKLAAGFRPRPNPLSIALSHGFPPPKPVWSAGCTAHVCGRMRAHGREPSMADQPTYQTLARHSAHSAVTFVVVVFHWFQILIVALQTGAGLTKKLGSETCSIVFSGPPSFLAAA